MSDRFLSNATPDDPTYACRTGYTSHPLYRKCHLCKKITVCKFGQDREDFNFLQTHDKKHLHCYLGIDFIKKPGEDNFCREFCTAKKTCFAYMFCDK